MPKKKTRRASRRRSRALDSDTSLHGSRLHLRLANLPRWRIVDDEGRARTEFESGTPADAAARLLELEGREAHRRLSILWE